ncbi:MAG TPA: hypothetical protein VGM96_18395 [Reyranella sp.]|jgi:hypothetical protein
MRTSLAVGVAALILLSGCDWLGIGSSTPTSSEKARPGAERQVGVTNSLPAARASGYDSSFAPVDETRSAPRIGSVVQGKGGQKAQKEAAEKDANQREAKDREDRARQQREADLKTAADKASGKPATPGDAMPPAAPAPSTDAVPPPPAPPLAAPVTSAPLTPPAAPAAPSSDTKQ